ncbi:MAG: hypothetical protein IT374_18655 [Polyangiaceae bacterium]|nr:hypothetical protein [Polyangiaceae bacterium]
MRSISLLAAALLPTLVLAHAACSTDDEPLPAGEGGGVYFPPKAGAAGSAGKATAGAAGTGGATAGAGGATAGAGGAGAGGATAGAGGAGAGGATAGAGGAGAGGATAGAGGAGAGGATAGAGGSAGGLVLTGTPETKATALAHLTVKCADSVDASFYDAAPPPSPWTSANRGDLVRCAYDRLVTKQEMDAHFADNSLPDPDVQVGAHKIRVVYWTERAPGEPLLTSGSLYLPELNVAANPPLLAVGHGTVGIADKCAPSREDAAGYHLDWRSETYSLVGHGWPAIVPDFPGIGTPGVGTWMMALDEGHALLDGTRLARKMSGAYFSSKNLLVGHSNGGHAALAAQSYAASYGAGGTIEGALVYAGYWLNNGAWGALLTPAGGLFATDGTMSFGMMYTYGHLAAYEGEAAAMDAFSKTAGAGGAGGAGGAPTGMARWTAARDFLENSCWQDMLAPATAPSSFGVMKGPDLFTSEYQTEVGNCGLTDAPASCSSPLAAKWRARWVADRPDPDPSIPVVWWQGAKDTTIAPNRARCGVDRLKAFGADLTVCGDASADHQSIVSAPTAWVRAYLAHRLLDGPAPPACADGVVDAVTCSVPPPNPLTPSSP